MWNDLNIKNPIQDICEYGKKDTALIENLPELVTVLSSAADILTHDHPIWEEIKVFKNLQTKYKRILHCDKCLQYLQRVGTCLRKMVLLNLSTMYLDLADKIILELQKPHETSYFLPSRQQLEYVLIRTQAAAKLLCESLHYSRETFCYLIQRLKVGHLIINLMMATSVTARLNIVFKGLLLQVFDVYKKLFVWRQKLRKGGYEWPKPLDLPEDLETWINIEDSEYLKPRHLPKEELDFLTTIFDKNCPTERDQENQETMSDTSISLQNTTSDERDNPYNNDDDIILVEDNNDCDNDDGVVIERSEVDCTVVDPPSPSSCNTLEIIPYTNSSSSDELTTSPVKKIKLIKSQKVLLKKVKAAEDLKELKNIWDNLDFNAPDLLPQILTPGKIRLIDKMFVGVKRKLTQLKKSNISKAEQKNEANYVIKIARLKFAKNLGLLQTEQKIKKKTKIVNKPVRTFKELKALYETAYQTLQTAQEYKKCAKLKKTFKSRKADLKLLVESGEKDEAKLLIFNTSKFILNYLK